MRVVHIIEATEGGTRRWIENVILGLDPRRVQQACICATRRDKSFHDSIRRFRENGVQIWALDMCRGIAPWRDLHATLQILALLRSHRFDIVHLHSSKAGLVGRLAAQLVPQRSVLYSPHAFSFLAGGFTAPLFRSAEWLLRPFTDAVVAVSRSEAELSRSLGFPESAVHTIPNGVSTTSVPSPLNRKRGCPIIGTVTSFRRQKDPETFLRACALLRNRSREIRFVLCGAGPALSRMRKLAKRLGLSDCVEFTGWVDDIPQRLDAWDVFVLATHYEGLSYALLEAMAAGKAIVASRVPGVEEALRDGQSGLFVPAGSPNSLAVAVEKFLTDPDFALRLGAAARVRVQEKYALKTQLESLTSLYESIKEAHSSFGNAAI